MNGDLKQTFVDVVNDLLNDPDKDVVEKVSTQIHFMVADGWRIPMKTIRGGSVKEIYDIEWSDRKC